MLALASAVQAQLTLTTSYSTGTVTTQRGARLKRDTFPTLKTIYYLDGSTWKSVQVGPGLGEGNITISNHTHFVRSTATYTGNQGPAGTQMDLPIPANAMFVQFAMSAAARTEGPYENILVDLPSYSCKITYGSSSFQGLTHTHEPPVYIFRVGTPEGGDGLGFDPGGPPDYDGDGIPDEQDPDDDNDGTPDTEDPFPQDPDETGDNDGDGTGDNEDLDDDNDGTPDTEDKFPKNPQEDSDNDGDGVGDNQDPDDNTKPPPDAGDGDNDDVGDGSGNPGTGDGGGGGGVPGDSTDEIGDLGAPADLQKRPKSYFDKQVKTTPGEVSGGVTGVPIEETTIGFLADSVQQLGTDAKDKLSNWAPFSTLGSAVGGDLTQWSITTQAFGTVTIPFPVQPQSIGVFRACCLFALYWGYCLYIMRILRI